MEKKNQEIFDLVYKFKENKLHFEKEYEVIKYIFNVKEENDKLLFENEIMFKNLVFARDIKESQKNFLKEMKNKINDQIILNLIDKSIVLYDEIHSNNSKPKKQLKIKDFI